MRSSGTFYLIYFYIFIGAVSYFSAFTDTAERQIDIAVIVRALAAAIGLIVFFVISGIFFILFHMLSSVIIFILIHRVRIKFIFMKLN